MPAATSLLTAAALIGGGISAYGQYQQGMQAKDAADYNAQIAEGEAGMIRSGASLNLYRQRKQALAVTGAQAGKYSRAGVSIGTGTPLDVMADSLANANLEIEIGQFNASQEARRKESEAKILRKYGKEDLNLAKTKAAGTLLSTATESGYRISKETGKTKIGE